MHTTSTNSKENCYPKVSTVVESTGKKKGGIERSVELKMYGVHEVVMPPNK